MSDRRILGNLFRSGNDFERQCFEQLGEIFSGLERDRVLGTTPAPRLMVDLAVKVADGRLLVFELIHLGALRSVGYSAYTRVAPIREAISKTGTNEQTIVAILTNGLIDDPVREFLAESGIPIARLGPNPAASKSELRTAFEHCSLQLQELADASELDEAQIESIPAPGLVESDDLGTGLDSILDKCLRILSSPRALLVVTLLAALGSVTHVSITGPGNIWRLSLGLIGLSLMMVILHGLMQKGIDRGSLFSNSNIVIQHDSVRIIVGKTIRLIERKISMKAKKPANEYYFLSFLSGLDADSKIACKETKDYRLEILPPQTQQSRLHPYRLRFRVPMKANEGRTVTLLQKLKDNDRRIFPYQFVYCDATSKCESLEVRLSFMDRSTPRAVYFVNLEDDVPVFDSELRFHEKLQAYVVSTTPRKNENYGVRWDEIQQDDDNI